MHSFLISLKICITFIFFTCLSGTALADSRFTFVDIDGDLLADPPASPERYLDPEVLVYSSTPEAEKKNLSQRHAGIMALIAERTGKKVVFLETSSSLEQIEKMRDGELHISGFSTGTTGFAVNLAGFIPVAVKAKDDQTMGYHLQIIVQSKSPYYSLQDLKGQQIAHTSPTSNSGNIAPRALLPNFGLVPDKTYDVTYSGKHKKSIVGVADGTYPAAAIASSVLLRMIDSGAVSADDFRILYTSPKFPTLARGYVYNLMPELAQKIKKAILEYSFPPEIIKLYKGANHYLPISYKDDWEIIRHITQYNGYEYTEEGLKTMLLEKKK